MCIRDSTLAAPLKINILVPQKLLVCEFVIITCHNIRTHASINMQYYINFAVGPSSTEEGAPQLVGKNEDHTFLSENSG